MKKYVHHIHEEKITKYDWYIAIKKNKIKAERNVILHETIKNKNKTFLENKMKRWVQKEKMI